MIRMQIQLTEAQANALRRRANERRTSIAAIVREAVETHLVDDRRDEAWQRALAAVGRFRGGAADVSVEHDRYLVEAYRTPR
jgi:hypothetical protein